MSDSARKLPVYREGPADVAYRQGVVEAANCEWCRWGRGYMDCGHPAQDGLRDPEVAADPILRRVAAPLRGTQVEWNRGGDCARFSPTHFTRLLRLVGLRAPAWKDA